MFHILGDADDRCWTWLFASELRQPLFFGFLEEANRVLVNGGRLVLVTPYLKTRSGKPVRMPIEEKAGEIGLKRVYPFRKEWFAGESEAVQKLVGTRSMWDVAERHKVGREIHIFQK